MISVSVEVSSINYHIRIIENKCEYVNAVWNIMTYVYKILDLPMFLF